MNHRTHNRGIRTQVLVIALAPAATISLLLTAWFTYAQVGALERAALHRGRALTRQLAAAAGAALHDGDRQALSELAAELLEQADVTDVSVREPGARPLIHVQGQAHEGDPDLTFQAAIPAQPAVGAPDRGGAVPDPIGWAQVKLSGRSLRADQQRAVFEGIVIALLGLTLSALLALRLGRRVSEPVRKLAAAIGAHRGGQLQTRAHSAVAAELETLENGIQRLTGALEDMQRRLQARLAQATEDLRQTLTRLETRNRTLAAARDRAGEDGRMRAQFLDDISHEMRTPMNAITGFTNLLLKTPLDREQRDYACTVRDAAHGLLTVINDRLDFARIAAGECALDHGPFDLRRVLDGALAIMAPAAYDKQLDLALLYYRDVPELLLGDAVRIRQLLMKLLGNAIEFTPRGRVVVRVMVEEETATTVVLRISVQDTGIGLSPDDRAHLLAAFARADLSPTGAANGIGLGLVTCRQLAARMGGALGLKSEPGAGSTFWFSFRAELQTDTSFEYEPSQSLAGVRAWLYEPDELHRSALCAQFEAWDMAVEVIPTPSSLHERLGGGRPARLPQLVCLGLHPEDLETPEVAHLLARGDGQRRYALIALLGTVNRRVLGDITAAGAAYALPRIVARDELHAALRQALDQARPRDGSYVSASHDPSPGLASVRILVVDDHVINRKLMCTLYRKAGATVDAAADGERALELLAAGRYDLIFMDLQMPGMSGVETAERIRAVEREYRRTPIIAVTAAAAWGEHERLIRAGFDDCLLKPVHEAELWNMAFKWLEPHAHGACAYETKSPWLRVAEPGPDEPGDPDRWPDRDRAVRIAGGDEELARELFAMLLAELPELQRRLRSAFAERDLQTLESEAHKLHGAAAYCAVEPLRAAAAAVERAARNDERSLAAGMETVDREIEALLQSSRRPD